MAANHMPGSNLMLNRSYRTLWMRILAGLAAIVVFITTYMLILPAITLETDPVCGYQEHGHSEECYHTAYQLTCEQGEYEGHIHSEDCYGEDEGLICEQAEAEGHFHGESCYTAETELLCQLPEHAHIDACFPEPEPSVIETVVDAVLGNSQEEVSDLPIAQENSPQDPADSGVGTVQGNPQADLESEEIWKASFARVELTGNWPLDVVAIAESQKGYTESTANYYVESNHEHKGITRYGQWYGDPYGDWCAMFASFCVYYAGVESFPLDENCANWISRLAENGYYHSRANALALNEKAAASYDGDKYVIKAGDLIFFSNGLKPEAVSDHVGIVKTVQKNKIVTIEGNSSNMVRENTYDADSTRIVGYGSLPENPAYAAPEAMTMARSRAAGISPLSADAPVNLAGTGVLTGVSGSGTQYNKEKDIYTTDLAFNFSFQKSFVNANGLDYYFDLGSNIILSDSLLGQSYPLRDGDGSTYKFAKNSNGTYRVEMHLTQSYVDGAGATMTGNVSFMANIDRSAVNDNGNINTPFTSDLTLNVPGGEIRYPGGTSKDYDLQAWKDNPQYNADNNTLTYTVWVNSDRGTPTGISFEDQLSGDILGKLNGTPTVIIQSADSWGQYNQDWNNAATENIFYNYSNGKITCTLPQISGRTNNTANKAYKITYTYPLQDGAYSVNGNNAVKVSSQGNGQLVNASDTKPANVSREITMGKSGQYDAATGKITWTIQVNKNHLNIAGAAIFDEMFSDGSNFSYTPNSGIQADLSNDKISFNATSNGKNTNSYTITYQTNAPAAGFGSQSVSNTATFDGDGNPGTTEDQKPGVGTATVGGQGGIHKSLASHRTVDGKEILTWNVSVDVPAGGLAAGTEIKDEIVLNGGYSDDHYMTLSQIFAWGSKFRLNGTEYGPSSSQVGYDGIIFQANDWQDYNYGYLWDHREDSALANLKFRVSTIKLKGSIPANAAGSLTFGYSTTAENTDRAGRQEYANKVTVGSLTASDNYTVSNGGVQKLDGGSQSQDTSVSNEDGTLTWIVRVTPDTAITTYRVIDTLPASIVLQSLNLDGNAYQVPADGNINYDSYRLHFEGFYNKETGVVTIDMTPTGSYDFFTNGSAYHDIKYNCLVDKDSISGYQSGTPYEFGNSVVVKRQDDTELGRDSQKQTWTEEAPVEETDRVDKGGVWDHNAQVVHYQIKLNPKAEDLYAGRDLLMVEDVMTYPIMRGVIDRYYFLDQNSVKLYYMVDGQKGDPVDVFLWSYSSTEEFRTYGGDLVDYETADTAKNVITAMVPDGTALILEYDYCITMGHPETWGGAPIDIENTAKLYGGSSEDSKTSRSSEKWQASETHGQIITDKGMILYKVEEGKQNVQLADAEFRIYSVNADGSPGNEIPNAVRMTDSKGRILIEFADGGFNKNTVYAIKETQAPDGYLMPDAPVITYFYFEDETDTQHTLPAAIPAGAYNLGKRTYSVTITNEKLPSDDVRVTKKWFTADGEAKTAEEGASVTFDLYRSTAAAAASLNVPENGICTESMLQQIGAVKLEQAVQLDASNNWIWTRNYDSDGSEYRYFVVETSTGNYLTTYKGQKGTNLEIDNTDIPETKVRVSKEWFAPDGSPLPENEKTEIRFDLWRAAKANATALEVPADGIYTEEMMNQIQAEKIESSQALNQEGSWIWEKTCQQTDGGDYSYFVIETSTGDFKTSYTGQGSDTLQISNKKNSMESVTVSKEWFKSTNGSAPQPVTQSGYIEFDLYRVARKTEENPGEGGETGGGSEGGETGGGSEGGETGGGSEGGETGGGNEGGETGGGSEGGETGGGNEGGETGGGSEETVTVRVQRDYNSGDFAVSETVPAGSAVVITATRVREKNPWYKPELTASVNGTALSVSQYDTDNEGGVAYQITLRPDADSLIVIHSDIFDYLEWSIEIQNAGRRAFAPMRSAGRSAIPSDAAIPSNAEKLNTEPLRIYGSDWTWSGSYPAEPGYTYEYYAAELNNSNYQVSYSGQGTRHLVITNTITEQTYDLPHTGGTGTYLYTLGGLLLMAGAWTLMYRNKLRGKEVS